MEPQRFYILLLVAGLTRFEPAFCSKEAKFIPRRTVREINRVVKASMVEEIRERLEAELREPTREIQNIRRNIMDSDAVCNITTQYFWDLCRPLLLRTCALQYQTECGSNTYLAFKIKLYSKIRQFPPPTRPIFQLTPILELFDGEISRLNDSTSLFRDTNSNADGVRKTKARITLKRLREKYPNIFRNSPLAIHRSRSPPPKKRFHGRSVVEPGRVDRRPKRRRVLSRPKRWFEIPEISSSSFETGAWHEPMMRETQPYMVQEPRIESWANDENRMSKEVESMANDENLVNEEIKEAESMANDEKLVKEMEDDEALSAEVRNSENNLYTPTPQSHIPFLLAARNHGLNVIATDSNGNIPFSSPQIDLTNQRRVQSRFGVPTTVSHVEDINTADNSCLKLENPDLCLENAQGIGKCEKQLKHHCARYVATRSMVKKALGDLRLKQQKSSEREIHITYKWATQLIRHKRPIIVRSIKLKRGFAYVSYRLSVPHRSMLLQFKFDPEGNQPIGQAIGKALLKTWR